MQTSLKMLFDGDLIMSEFDIYQLHNVNINVKHGEQAGAEQCQAQHGLSLELFKGFHNWVRYSIRG